MEKRIIVCGIVCSGNNILLGKKSKGRPPYPDVWHTLGGGVKDLSKGEKLLERNEWNDKYFLSELDREIMEESNIEIKNAINICPKYRNTPREAITENKYGNKMKYVFLEYLCELDSDITISKAGDDIAQIQWIDKKDLENINLTPPSQEMYKELSWL